MSINLTDEIEVKTKKGKLSAAKQIFLEGDTQTVEKEIQDINSRHNTLNTKHESLSRTVQGISATGGASTANNVTYNNDSSGLNAENAQDAIDELQSSIADETTRAKAAEEAIIFDVSSHNDGAVFESLSALLGDADLSTLIPTSVRQGGITIRFIQGYEQSSDNKYVQYRLTNQNWSINIADWQELGSTKFSTGENVGEVGIDDEPNEGSHNIITSNGVYKAVKPYIDIINTVEDGFFIVDNMLNIGAMITPTAVEGFENNNYTVNEIIN